MSYNGVEREYHKEYASKGVAGAGLGTGIAGLATGAPALIISAMNWLRDNNRVEASKCAAAAGITLAEVIALMDKYDSTRSSCNENMPATRWDITRAEANSEKMSAKDAEIAQLKGEKYTDGKVQELYNFIVGEFKTRDESFVAFRENTAEQFKEVAVYQATNTQALICLKGQVADLQAAFDEVTDIVVPANRVCSTNTGSVLITNTSANPVLTQTVK